MCFRKVFLKMCFRKVFQKVMVHGQLYFGQFHFGQFHFGLVSNYNLTIFFFFKRECVKGTVCHSKNSEERHLAKARPHLTEPCSDRPNRQQARCRATAGAQWVPQQTRNVWPLNGARQHGCPALEEQQLCGTAQNPRHRQGLVPSQ